MGPLKGLLYSYYSVIFFEEYSLTISFPPSREVHVKLFILERLLT